MITRLLFGVLGGQTTSLPLILWKVLLMVMVLFSKFTSFGVKAHSSPNGHKAIIFSQWSTIAKDLGIELSEYDPIVITGEVPPEQRQRLVDNFQTNPHCKVAIGTIGAMGTGLTLNKASYVFFMDKAWNSGDNAQAEDRAHRIGTVGAVNVISMVAKGTIDEAVEDYLLENKDLIDRVVDGKGSKQDIKTILNKLLSI